MVLPDRVLFRLNILLFPLQSAVNSLDTLNASDVTVVKTMKNPAPIVKFVVEAVCVMKGVLPERRPGIIFTLTSISKISVYHQK